MTAQPLPPVHDGSTGNVVQRAEPKVKAAALAAFLTPLTLYYLYRYVPGVAELPHELDVVLGTFVTGAVTFAAGFASRAVDRVDLMFGALAANVAATVTRAGDQTIGVEATDDLETWAHEIGGKVIEPVKAAVVDAVHAVEAAAAAGRDPLAAAEDQVPALEQAATDAVAPVAEAAAALAAPKTAAEFMAELQAMIALLDAGTPIGDALQPAAATPLAAAARTSNGPAPALAPAAAALPADPPTAPMAAVTAAAPVAG